MLISFYLEFTFLSNPFIIQIPSLYLLLQYQYLGKNSKYDLLDALKNKKLVQDFERWKKQAKGKINLMKEGKLTENEVYEWIWKINRINAI